MSAIIRRIYEVFDQRGDDQYGSEAVTQRQHALQSATLAQKAGHGSTLIVAALLHDIGHILSDHELPDSTDVNLDDQHETRAYEWLKTYFGPAVADPVRLHVAAKRYLCSKYPDYENKLSPTSRKSYHDQGGQMSEEELATFESEPHYKKALVLREWDDSAKDPNCVTPKVEHFEDDLKACLI